MEIPNPRVMYSAMRPLEGSEVVRVEPSGMGFVSLGKRPRGLQGHSEKTAVSEPESQPQQTVLRQRLGYKLCSLQTVSNECFLLKMPVCDNQTFYAENSGCPWGCKK